MKKIFELTVKIYGNKKFLQISKEGRVRPPLTFAPISHRGHWVRFRDNGGFLFFALNTISLPFLNFGPQKNPNPARGLSKRVIIFGPKFISFDKVGFFPFFVPIAVFPPFLRAKAECFARLCHPLGVCLSVRPSVCHTRDLY